MDTGKIYTRKCKDKNVLGIKCFKLSINILGANCCSLNNKKASITEIMEIRSVDIGVFSELNTKTPPKFKGLTTFSKISKHKFHNIGVYV